MAKRNTKKATKTETAPITATITVGKAMMMSAIRLCDDQMRFLDRIDGLGYRDKADYFCEVSADTITVTSAEMAADPAIIALFVRTLGADAL